MFNASTNWPKGPTEDGMSEKHEALGSGLNDWLAEQRKRRQGENMTVEEAISLAETKFWEKMTPREIATFQLFEEKLCMPFSVFHEAIEKTLGRPVFTHEFGMNVDGLRKELMGESPAPSMSDILNLIPAEKRTVLSVG